MWIWHLTIGGVRIISISISLLLMYNYYYRTEYSTELGMLYLFFWFLISVITAFFWLFLKVLYLIYEVFHLVFCYNFPQYHICETRKQKHAVRQGTWLWWVIWGSGWTKPRLWDVRGVRGWRQYINQNSPTFKMQIYSETKICWKKIHRQMMNNQWILWRNSFKWDLIFKINNFQAFIWRKQEKL